MSKIVDIIPTVSSTGQFKKITDEDAYNNNNKVSAVLNLLEYIEGSHSIYTDMGIYRLLNQIPYSENIDMIVNSMSTKLSTFLNFPVTVEYEYENELKEIVLLKITISGLPGKIHMSAKRYGNNVKLVNPKYIV